MRQVRRFQVLGGSLSYITYFIYISKKEKEPRTWEPGVSMLRGLKMARFARSEPGADRVRAHPPNRARFLGSEPTFDLLCHFSIFVRWLR